MALPVLDRTMIEQNVLSHVFKPARYLGIEFGAYRKDPNTADCRMAMIFPDLYEIGVSNYGHKLLYSLVNNQPYYLCDRAYAPDKDMMKRLKELDIPLYGIETMLPLKHFELLAFTLQYELNYTSILGVLDSAQVPFRSADRPDWSTPILIAGGPGSGNPMPVAPFFDGIIVGDGEEVLLELLALIAQAKKDGWTKQTTRHAMANVEGVYVHGVSTVVRKRIVDITQQHIPLAPLVPYIQTVHDRVTIEARRGCDRMCRFCQPCFINLPVREQSIDTIKQGALEELEKTGYEECSLLSLSIADYSQLKPLIYEVADTLADQGASLSLPSQRADRFDIDIAEAVQQVRKSTLTFAPEAGSERLRAVINKNLTEKEIMDAITSSYQAGWNKVKLYFMIGLPTETDIDLLSIVRLVEKMQQACLAIARDTQRSKKSGLEINVTLSNFVPKPHTPFQWFPQDTMAELTRKRFFLKDAFKRLKGIKLNFTDPEISKLECCISKGDARMADVIEKAYLKGDYLSAWDENLLFPQWFEALKEEGIDPDTYTSTAYTHLDQPLPWNIIHMGLESEWLQSEYHKALEEANSDPCFIGCSACGVCPEFSVQPIFIRPKDVANRPKRIDERLTKAERFPPPVKTARLTLHKKGYLKYISHLDWLRMLHRAIQRAQVPVAYSQGFNPSPKVSFGPALPLYVEGFCEHLDIALTKDDPELLAKLNAQLPPEGQITSCTWLGAHPPSLDSLVRFLRYSARRTSRSDGSEYNVHDRIHALSAQPVWEVPLEKRGTDRKTLQSTAQQTFDLKPFVDIVQVISPDEVQFTLLYTRTGSRPRPEWLLKLIDATASWQITRLEVGLATTDEPSKALSVASTPSNADCVQVSTS